MIKDFGFPGLGLRDERLIQHIEHILAHTLQFGLDFLAVFTDSANVLI